MGRVAVQFPHSSLTQKDVIAVIRGRRQQFFVEMKHFMVVSSRLSHIVKAWLFFFVYSFVLLLVVSPDSYFHDLFNRVDSAWFFTCGKALMNGLTPYVDFTDSKGLFLWVIYGSGYLIDNDSYVGVFWLTVVAYSIVLLYCYRAARLVNGDTRKAVVVACLLMVIILLCTHHYETRAEDWATLFLAPCLYHIVRCEKFPERKNLLRLAVVVGVCMGAVLLIKWNIAVMFCIFALYTLVESYRCRCHWRAFINMAVGFIVFVLPFVVYMLCVGCFDDMLNEYVFNTFQTIVNKSPLSSLSNIVIGGTLRVLYAIGPESALFWFLLGNLLLKGANRILGIKFAIFTLWFLIFLSYNPLTYYFQILPLLALPTVILLVDLLPTCLCRKFFGATIGLLVLAGCWNLMNTQGMQNRFSTTFNRSAFWSMDYVMSQVAHPTLVFTGMEHDGKGVLSNALPGCKYYARQNGETKAMRIERETAIKNHIPDFVIVQETDTASVALVEKSGYVAYNSAPYCSIPQEMTRLYGPAGLKLPPKGFMPSNIDILFKRNILLHGNKEK